MREEKSESGCVSFSKGGEILAGPLYLTPSTDLFYGGVIKHFKCDHMYVLMYLRKASYLDRPTQFYLTTSSGFHSH